MPVSVTEKFAATAPGLSGSVPTGYTANATSPATSPCFELGVIARFSRWVCVFIPRAIVVNSFHNRGERLPSPVVVYLLDSDGTIDSACVGEPKTDSHTALVLAVARQEFVLPVELRRDTHDALRHVALAARGPRFVSENEPGTHADVQVIPNDRLEVFLDHVCRVISGKGILVRLKYLTNEPTRFGGNHEGLCFEIPGQAASVHELVHSCA